ncbi:MAG: ABC transporter substrate-binding protein [Sphaerochaetaceae bacterium]|nr:ABC transporter substrate-binding protein [Spirochaetales bacterium]MDY5498482.1 ABC transporter substrate-binding protein [Sphaerochaetaceae bacterium]
MKKNMVIGLLLALVASSPLFAQGAKEAEAPQQTVQTEGKEPVSIRFSWWGNDSRHKATIDAINLFMQKKPNIEVIAEYRGKSERDKVATELAGGTVADVVQLNPPWMGDFTSNGDFFEDLNNYSNVLDLSGFSKQFLEDNAVYGGKLVGLPTGVNARTAILNKTLAEKFGVPTSMDTKWTWDDFYTIGKKIHEKDPSKYFLNADTVDMTEFLLLPYLVQLTGNQLIKDDKTRGFTESQLVEVLAYIAKLYKDGVVIPVQDGNVFLNSVWTNPKWLKGDIMYEFSWTSLYGAVTNDVAKGNEMSTFILPCMTGAKNTGLIIVPSQLLAVSSKSAHKQEAVEFLNFFFNDVDAGLILKDVRSVPPVAKVQDACQKASLINGNIIKATQYAEENQGLSRNSLSSNTEIVKVLNDAIETVAYDPNAVEKTAKESIKMIDYILSEL